MKQTEQLKAHNSIMSSYLGNNKYFQHKESFTVDGRNNLWMSKIPQLIEDNSSFIAVGAAHLGGVNGLINQLRKQGYTVISMSNDN